MGRTLRSKNIGLSCGMKPMADVGIAENHYQNTGMLVTTFPGVFPGTQMYMTCMRLARNAISREAQNGTEAPKIPSRTEEQNR